MRLCALLCCGRYNMNVGKVCLKQRSHKSNNARCGDAIIIADQHARARHGEAASNHSASCGSVELPEAAGASGLIAQSGGLAGRALFHLQPWRLHVPAAGGMLCSDPTRCKSGACPNICQQLCIEEPFISAVIPNNIRPQHAAATSIAILPLCRLPAVSRVCDSRAIAVFRRELVKLTCTPQLQNISVWSFKLDLGSGV